MPSTCCAPRLCIKPFVLLLIRCPHGTLLVDIVDLDRTAAGMDVDVAAGWRIRGTLRGRMVLPEVQHWKLVESYGLQTLCECHETSLQEKVAVLEKTIAGMGDDEPIFGESAREAPEETQWPEAWKLGDFALAAICGRCGVGRCIDVCCRNNGVRGLQN